MRNMWGTDPAMVNGDEFCRYCEREVPGHYEGCPTRARCDYCGEAGHQWQVHSQAWRDVEAWAREEHAANERQGDVYVVVEGKGWRGGYIRE